eukprot:c14897_g1_i1.p1 GENE.c14897_g1_i1~~c14897_g1_i1.p1  ORF type:complete len:376 (+),score=-40.53 c14897_g1_i1:45-1172(+)
MLLHAALKFFQSKWKEGNKVTPFEVFERIQNDAQQSFKSVDGEGKPQYTLISQDKKLVRDVEISSIPGLTKPYWLTMIYPTSDDLSLAFPSLHPLTLWEIFSVPNLVREKVDAFDDYLFIHTHDEKMVQMHILLFNDNCIVTIIPRLQYHHRSTYPSWDLVHQKIEDMGYHIPSNNWVLHSLLYALLSLHANDLLHIAQEKQEIDEEISRFSPSSTAASLHLLEKIQKISSKASYMYWFMHSKQQMLIGLSSFVSSSQQHINIQHLDQVLMTNRYRLQLLREGLDNSRDTFLNSINIIANSHIEKCNKDTVRFAAVFTLLTPLMVVLGLFSMNVPVVGGWDGGADRRHIWFYWIISVFAVIVVTGIIYGLQKSFI